MSKVIWYCQDCGTEMMPRRITCTNCRGKDVYTGAVWDEEKKTFHCACGCTTGRMIAHCDFTDYYNSTVKCRDCGNIITTQNKRIDKEYW